MPSISVITPSVRPKGIAIVEKALRRQTLTDYEHIVDTSQEKNPGDYWGVYKAYNRMVKKAKGELIVSWQDFTFADHDALEKFWNHYQQEPKTLVGAVGGKYQDDSWTVKTWADPRERDDQGTYYEVNYQDIEWNLCSVPKEAIYHVGGFDEFLDKYSSVCGLDVLARLEIDQGYKFKLDQTIKSYSLEHGRLPKWEENEPFNGPWEERLKYYLANPRLDYLK